MQSFCNAPPSITRAFSPSLRGGRDRIEPVPSEHILGIQSSADLTHLHLLVNASSLGAPFTVAVDGTNVEATGLAGTALSVAIPAPRHIWSPVEPDLYNFTVTLASAGGGSADSVRSYFGMRTFSLGTVDGTNNKTTATRPLLNGKYHFAAGWLDQSWWPDGQCERHAHKSQDRPAVDPSICVLCSCCHDLLVN